MDVFSRLKRNSCNAKVARYRIVMATALIVELQHGKNMVFRKGSSLPLVAIPRIAPFKLYR